MRHRTLVVLLATACSSHDDLPRTPSAAPPATTAARTVDSPTELTFFVTDADASAIGELVDRIGDARLSVVTDSDPANIVDHGAGTQRIAVVRDGGECGECFRMDGASGRYVVHAGGVLGAQYGVAEALEAAGFRFYHPFVARAPDAIGSVSSAATGADRKPDLDLRGLHLHTLHPIEGYWAFWEPSDAGLEQAKAVVDWVVKLRGNYLEWVALNDIVTDGTRLAPWKDHTKKILDYAHARGIQTGIGIQLYATGSLQNGYTLIKNSGVASAEDDIHDAMHPILDGLPFDHVNLSFGEFSGANPHSFVDHVNFAEDGVHAIAKDARMDATVHLGNYPNLQVSYMGETLLYYYLVKWTHPTIARYVHTVMYFDLFEPAAGAYDYDDFSTHRQFLFDELAAGHPAAYYPETAYWVAFDDSVPVYLPVYMRSRWLDLAQIRAQAPSPLRQHHVFSSGWEWGYWQNDYAAMRYAYALPSAWDDTLKDMLAPYGDGGAKVAEAVRQVAELQDAVLIQSKLAPYLAGRDDTLDLGDSAGKVAAPTRPSFDAIAKLAGPQANAFEVAVVMPLWQMAAQVKSALMDAKARGVDPEDPWMGEILDGLEVTMHRAQFVGDLYAAALAKGNDGTDDGHLAEADQELLAATEVVARRHARRHDMDPRLVTKGNNATVYGYGYLYEADQLCYWKRERAQAGNTVTGTTGTVPSCVF